MKSLLFLFVLLLFCSAQAATLKCELMYSKGDSLLSVPGSVEFDETKISPNLELELKKEKKDESEKDEVLVRAQVFRGRSDKFLVGTLELSKDEVVASSSNGTTLNMLIEKGDIGYGLLCSVTTPE